MFVVVVCFITKSFLTYSFVRPTPTLSTICRPLSSHMCSITPETVNVGSSYGHMRDPGVGCWLSDRSNCSHCSFEAAVLPINPNIYTDQWEPIVIYHSITLTGHYTTMQPTLLTSWRQLLSYKVQTITAEVCTVAAAIAFASVDRSSRIFHFSHWLGQLSTVLTKDEIPLTGYTFTPWVVSFTPLSIEH